MQLSDHTKKRLQVKIDKNLAEQAETIFDELGINTTSAITAFYKRVIAENGLPFEMKLSPEEQLHNAVQQQIDAGQVTKLGSQEELQAWLSDEE